MSDTAQKQKSKQPPPRIWTRDRVIGISGMAATYGCMAAGIFALFDDKLSQMPTAYLSFLLLVPIGIGALSVYNIPPQYRTPGRSFRTGVLTTALFLIAMVILNPLVLMCTLMASPFILVLAAIVAVLNSALSLAIKHRKQKHKTHYAFTGLVMLLPFIMLPAESRFESPVWTRTVEDSIVIDADAATVWDNIIRMDTISEAEQRPSWYHTLGIPRPIRATLNYEGVGGIREGEFEYGLRFREQITTWQLHESVSFDVEVISNDRATPVLSQIGANAFDVLSAGYRIEVINDSQVRLSLYSNYRLSTNFNGYAAFWSDWIMRDFQTYVLNTVKNRVES